MVDPSQPRLFFVSPGFTPEYRKRTRTSPGPGSGSGNSPAWRTSPAGPCCSYQTARTSSPDQSWVWSPSRTPRNQVLSARLVARATTKRPLR